MLKKQEANVCWGIGLSEQQEKQLRKYMGKEFVLQSKPEGCVPAAEELDFSGPCLLWISPDVNKKIGMLPAEEAARFSTVPRVLVLNEGYTLEDFEAACDAGVTEIVRPPLTAKKVKDILYRATEAENLHSDMLCMVREVALEREILERKNAVLQFLVDFLASTSENLDLPAMLEQARRSLTALFPVSLLHLALWNTEQPEGPGVSLYLDGGGEHEERRHEVMMDQVYRYFGPNFTIRERVTLSSHSEKESFPAPNQDDMIFLPVTVFSARIGVLALETSEPLHLGRDHAVALDSALQHLALSINNARRYHSAQIHADYDSLTRLHNRRHFDRRFAEEADRFERYGQSFGLIMLDIDHFKSVNDTRGHLVGDAVLREVASIIAGSVRTSDYCARYGGEEFVIILPNTEAQKSYVLAERIRKAVAKHTFFVEGGPLRVTVSMGVAAVGAESAILKTEILGRADAALYESKRGGRDRCSLADCGGASRRAAV